MDFLVIEKGVDGISTKRRFGLDVRDRQTISVQPSLKFCAAHALQYTMLRIDLQHFNTHTRIDG